MICNITCLISIVFLVGMFYKTYSIDKHEIHSEFVKILDDNQNNTYKKIVNERRSLHFRGFSLGLLISCIIIVYNYYYRDNKINSLSIACLVGSTTFLVQYFYYILSKKSDWMILHLKNKDQTKAWLKVYKTMQTNYHMGLVLGIISVIILSLAFKC